MKRPYELTDAPMLPIYGIYQAYQYFEEFLSKELLKLSFVRTVSDQ